MKILYIGEAQTHNLYMQGKVPSHWLYGAVEMEKDGKQVVWEQERKSLLNDLKLVWQVKPDAIFIPNLNIGCHVLLLLLSSFHILNIPVFAYLHHTPNCNGWKKYLYKRCIMSVSHLFFLSEKSMEETIEGGFTCREKCSVPGWGADMDFYSKVDTSDEGYFVSTGKENRDFDTLIQAFRKMGAKLKIMTAKSHAGQNYEDLEEKCKNIPNIEVIITENSGNVYPKMLQAMAHAKAIVCPLKQDKLNYCVGLSTIADAEGLHKPLIITRNPYHTDKRLQNFDVVASVEDWIQKIMHVSVPLDNNYSMQHAYQNMKKYIDAKIR